MLLNTHYVQLTETVTKCEGNELKSKLSYKWQKLSNKLHKVVGNRELESTKIEAGAREREKRAKLQYTRSLSLSRSLGGWRFERLGENTKGIIPFFMPTASAVRHIS